MPLSGGLLAHRGTSVASSIEYTDGLYPFSADSNLLQYCAAHFDSLKY